MVWFDLHTINTLKLSTERTIKPMNGFWTKFAFWVAIVVVVVVYADIHTIQVRIHSIGIYKFKFNGHTVVHQNFCYSYVFFVLRFSFKQFKVKIFQRIPLKCSNAIVGIDEYVCILCVCCFPSQAHTKISSELLILINLLRDWFFFSCSSIQFRANDNVTIYCNQM